MKKIIAITIRLLSMLTVFSACTQEIRISRIKLPEYSEIIVGGSIDLNPIYESECTNEERINKAVGELILIWSSSDDDILKVTDGKVTGISYGEAMVSVSTEDSSLFAETKIKVKSPVEAIIAEDFEMIEQEKDAEIIYSLVPEDVSANVIMTIDDESIAKITDGKISAITPGETTITIKADDKEKTVKIIVKEKKKKETVKNPLPVTKVPTNSTSTNDKTAQVITPVRTPNPSPMPTPTPLPESSVITPTPAPTPIPTPEASVIAPQPTLDNNQNLGDTHNPGYSAADNPVIED